MWSQQCKWRENYSWSSLSAFVLESVSQLINNRAGTAASRHLERTSAQSMSVIIWLNLIWSPSVSRWLMTLLTLKTSLAAVDPPPHGWSQKYTVVFFYCLTFLFVCLFVVLMSSCSTFLAHSLSVVFFSLGHSHSVKKVLQTCDQAITLLYV